MSRSTRDSVRRRASLLATTSFVAASVLGSAGALTATFLPSVALANSECTNLSGLVVCDPPSTKYTAGVTYTAAAVTTTTGILLNDVNVTNKGVTLTSNTAGADLSVQTTWETTQGGAASNVTATTGNGITVESNAGADV